MGCIIQDSMHYMQNQNQIGVTYSSDGEAKNHLHFVFWSGGYDSTLLLYELIEIYGFNNVVAVSYKYPWLGPKYNNERISREAFKAAMKLKYGDVQIRHIEIDVSVNTVSGCDVYAHGLGLPQSVAWLLSIPLYVPPKSYIYDGGIDKDDLTLKLNSYDRTLESVSDLLMRDFVIRHPYVYMQKFEILEKLFKYGIYQYPWCCELSSNNQPCCRCKPCQTHISALMYLSEFSEDELVRLQVSRELSKIKELRVNHSAKDEKVTQLSN